MRDDLPGPERVKKLEIWQDAIRLAKQIYLLSAHWPKTEVYGLSIQVRRCAVSIPSNIAEGVGRGSRGEIIRFSQIALGSAYELHTQLYLALELEYGPEEQFTPHLSSLERLTKRIHQFVKYQEGQK